MNRPTILLVEDSEDDVELAAYAFKRSRLTPTLVTQSTGEAALDYLKRIGGGDSPRPDLVLMDLQLPGMSGLEVLRRMRADEPGIRRLPVVMLTTSDDPRDIAASYDLGANSYIRKPLDLADFSTVIDRLGEYWLQTNTRPPV